MCEEHLAPHDVQSSFCAVVATCNWQCSDVHPLHYCGSLLRHTARARAQVPPNKFKTLKNHMIVYKNTYNCHKQIATWHQTIMCLLWKHASMLKGCHLSKTNSIARLTKGVWCFSNTRIVTKYTYISLYIYGLISGNVVHDYILCMCIYVHIYIYIYPYSYNYE